MIEDADSPPTLTRIIALMRAGYVFDEHASKEVGNAVWLEHPALKRAWQPTLIVYESGLVVGLDNVDDEKKQLRIPTEADAEFWKFVASVPQPSWWELNRKIRYSVLGWVLLITCGIALYLLLGFAWNIVSPSFD